MNKYFLLAIIFLLGKPAQSQTPEDSVKMVINNLFTAMKNVDTALLQSVFADGAILQTIVNNASGKTSVKTDQVKDFIGIIQRQPINAIDEQITFEYVKADGNLATVWTPYKGTYMHHGVNSFQLVKTSSGWKIQYLIDTRVK
jgi:hypothetical protein